MADLRENRISGLLRFIDRSPTPFHAIVETIRMLEEKGFHRLDEKTSWQVEADQGYYLERHGTSIVAFRLGTAPMSEAGCRIAAAHSDSPTLRIKPESESVKHDVSRVAVEVYGHPIVSSWLDRELSIAGLVVCEGEEVKRRYLFDSRRPVAVIPNLALHLNRDINKGFEYNKQDHLQAILSSAPSETPGTIDVLRSFLASELDVALESIRDFDLFFFDSTPGRKIGITDDLIVSSRLDNLAMAHAIIEAIRNTESREVTVLAAVFDNEEVGSRTHRGADSSLLSTTISRLVGALGGGPEEYYRCLARSMAISADAAHGIHPNYPAKHDESYLPQLNGGPVIKMNAGYRYATTADTSAYFESLCRSSSIPVQKFIGRSDLPSGSTIGPITSAKLGVPTVDVGNPILAMHSIRETGGIHDHSYMIDALGAHFSAAETITEDYLSGP